MAEEMKIGKKKKKERDREDYSRDYKVAVQSRIMASIAYTQMTQFRQIGDLWEKRLFSCTIPWISVGACAV